MYYAMKNFSLTCIPVFQLFAPCRAEILTVTVPLAFLRVSVVGVFFSLRQQSQPAWIRIT